MSYYRLRRGRRRNQLNLKPMLELNCDDDDKRKKRREENVFFGEFYCGFSHYYYLLHCIELEPEYKYIQ